MKKVLIPLLVLTFLIGCSTQGQGLNESNSNDELQGTHVEVVHTGTIKQEIEMELTILSKPEGTTLHPHLVLATGKDEDHNTPLAFSVSDQNLFEELEIGETYHLKTYVIAVYEEQEEGIHHRFEFMILDFAQ